jgi:hypothetical protein
MEAGVFFDVDMVPSPILLIALMGRVDLDVGLMALLVGVGGRVQGVRIVRRCGPGISSTLAAAVFRRNWRHFSCHVIPPLSPAGDDLRRDPGTVRSERPCYPDLAPVNAAPCRGWKHHVAWKPPIVHDSHSAAAIAFALGSCTKMLLACVRHGSSPSIETGSRTR